MKKTYILEDLDCANCAAKLERAISGLDGVTGCTVSFFTQKLILEAPDDRFDDIYKQAKKTIRRLEPDVTVRA